MCKKIGFVAYSRHNLDLDGIITTIDRGLPVIAMVARLKKERAHLLVIRKYQTEPNVLYLSNSFLGRNIIATYSNFAKLWRINHKKNSDIKAI